MPYPKLLFSGPDGESLMVEIDKDVFTVGPGKGNDLFLGDPDPSRRHIEIRHRGASYHILDLDYRCANYVNGVVIREQVELKDGDVISVGDRQIEFIHNDG